MILHDQFGNMVDVTNAPIKAGDKVVILIAHGSETVISFKTTKRYVEFTVKALIEGGNRVKVHEIGGSWAATSVFKLKDKF